MSVLTRRLSIVAALVILAVSLYVMTQFQSQVVKPERAQKVEVLRDVSLIKVSNQNIGSSLDIQGRLSAFEKIDIFTEVAGRLLESSKPIKVGNYFEEGSILMRIDNEEAHLNLLSQKSNLMNAITQLMPDLKIDYPESFQQWKTYLDEFDVNKNLKALPEPLNDKEKYFIAARNLHGQYYTIKGAEKRLSKYTVYTPFAGVITESMVNPGSTVQPGQRLGQLMNKSAFELEATINLGDLKYIKKGKSVKLYSDDLGKEWNGKVARVSDQIDPNTQTVIAFIRVYGQNLREGMYLRGSVSTGNIANSTAIPLRVMINDDSVYEVKDSILSLRKVEVIKVLGSEAIIKDLPEGITIVNEKLVGAFDGMKVNPLPIQNAISAKN